MHEKEPFSQTSSAKKAYETPRAYRLGTFKLFAQVVANSNGTGTLLSPSSSPSSPFSP